jgi:hypothetical protein
MSNLTEGYLRSAHIPVLQRPQTSDPINLLQERTWQHPEYPHLLDTISHSVLLRELKKIPSRCRCLQSAVLE